MVARILLSPLDWAQHVRQSDIPFVILNDTLLK